MDGRYDTYCAVDPLFYDSLCATTAATPEFDAAGRPVPDGWQREPSDDWLIYGPEGGSLPAQGWKIHVSACLENAERVLDVVWEYCVPRGISFKFLRGPRMLLLRNAKYAHRGTSGKFVTVYPRDESELELACKELADLLDGEPGPYVLSDLRYGTGPVYVRYGGFAARYCVSAEGQMVPAMADPSGTLVPDRRDPVFQLPDWVTLPAFLGPQLAARNATTTTELPYRIERVIHFSNGGGLYVGRDTRTDTPVVLKEARPYAGLDATGTDAPTRLRREAEMLRRLADLPQVPRVHDEFILGDHLFLVLEFIEGRPLNRVLVERYPLINAEAGPAELTDYTAWALRVYRQVERIIDAIGRRGIVYGDLHLFNVMVGPDDRVALVDFEVAAPVAEASRPGLRSQGFAAPSDRTGLAVDRYALACLRLALFLPLTQLVRLAPAKAAALAAVIGEHFPVPRDFLDGAVAEISGTRSTDTRSTDTGSTGSTTDTGSTGSATDTGSATEARSTGATTDTGSTGDTATGNTATGDTATGDTATGADRPGVGGTSDYGTVGGRIGGGPSGRHRTRGDRIRIDPDPVPGTADFSVSPGSWPRLRNRLSGAIIASATPHRGDRLFPGDIEQFRAGGLNLAHGAAGVLYALHVTGAGRYPDYEDWLVSRALDPPPGTRCGFYDGLHGVAWALEHLGRRQEALDVLGICLRQPLTGLSDDLVGGLPGIALNLAEFAGRTGEPALRAAAWQAADLVAERLDDAGRRDSGDDGGRDSGDDGGRGPAGGARAPYPGLTRGRTGAALMFLRLYELSGDPELLDRSASALRQDLRGCVLRPDGALEVDEGWRTMPYLAHGSVGIGLVLDQYLRHRADDGLAGSAAAIRRAARSPFYAQSGLFAGRAGIIAYLAARAAGGAVGERTELVAQVSRLAWHAMPYQGFLAFPGEQLLRLSMDLATGTAGVLLALGAALHDSPVALPFLAPLTGATHSPRTGEGPKMTTS